MTDEGAEADPTLVLGSFRSTALFLDVSWKGKRAVGEEVKGPSIIIRVRETEAADLFRL